ncbi:MAG: beta-ketoacyl-[acyl-carrier-protein] synthase family protein [Candidatus Omnitrophica bacterium]|nr:beta-ketoacyl-[acyl-carrier-protein] synthase family protein [Candidatus Omnitrophota bacterium]
MSLKRVVITGIGAVSPLGSDSLEMSQGLEASLSAVQYMEGWDTYKGLRCLVAAPAKAKDEHLIPRQSRRSMGSMSIYSVQAAQEALNDSALPTEILKTGRVGCIIGSTMGGAKSINDVYENMASQRDLTQLTSMKFFQCMSHTAALNVSQYLGINGVVMATSAACASGLQAIGTAYDLIRLGSQDVILCGGAEELHPTVTASFDILFATSTKYNDRPQLTPRPFDANRDGLVCGEGAGIIVIESYEHAMARSAKIHAEIIGYQTCASGLHISQSSKEALASSMRGALAAAQINSKDIDYINAHATATLQGDKEEADAIREIFGDKVPVSSLKGYMGHTLGASGGLELIASLFMMRSGRIYPTKNLENVADDCQGIWHVQKPLKRPLNFILKNAFALGGINASIVLKRLSQ